MAKLTETILVTGGAGFIGSNFIRQFLTRHGNFQVINLDRLTYSGNLSNLKNLSGAERYRFVRGDIADPKFVNGIFKKYHPDYVINFAAETHVDKSIHESGYEFIRTNITGVFILLEAIRRYGVKKYVQVSTDEVFGSLSLASKKKFLEQTAFSPNSVYAATKAGGDILCNAYFRTWKIPAVITHCSNNYGPRQYPEKLIPFFILRLLEGQPLPLYGDGKNVRDWIYVLDHCNALESCLFKGKPGQIYNIGADNELSNLTITRFLLEYFKKDKTAIRFVNDRPGHDRRYAVDSSKIRRELGWKPKHDFKKTFQDTIRWYLKNPEWIERVKKKTAGVFNPHINEKK